MTEAKFLAIDLGASSGRGVVGSLENGKLIIDEVNRFENRPVTILGHLHWNIVNLYQEIIKSMRICAQDHSKQLKGIGIDTWGVDFGFIGKNNTIVGLPYAYRDHRTDSMVEKVCEQMPREEIYSHTGIQFMQLNSLFQLYAMVLEDSPILDSTDKILFMPDLLGFLYCGEKVSEFSIASTSQLYNPIQKCWAEAIFERLDLPLEKMANIVPTGTRLGPLFPNILKETGLKQAPIISTANHDTAAAVAAVPATDEDWAYLSSGTWSLMGIEIKKPIINEKSLVYNFTNEGGVGGSIRFLKNIMGLWLVQECRRVWANRGEEYDFGTLTQMAENAKSFNAFIDPDHDMFLHPENMPQAIKEFCQMTQQTTPNTQGEMIRVILESLAFKYRHTLEILNELGSKPIQVLHIVGGGTKNQLLCQFTANACGIPVLAGPVEATAIGNILVQAITVGELASIEEARQVVRTSFEVRTYEPKNKDTWNEMYSQFKTKALKI